MPDVSVIIPTTRRKLLERALASVDAQTDPPREVIVEEDPGRTGPAATRNRGAARARGSLLAFLDDDDAWEPAFLARVTPPEGCVLAYAALPHLPARDPRVGSPTVPSAAVLRAEAFRAVGGFRDFRYGEDYDLWLRLPGPFHRVEEPLVRFTHRDDDQDLFLALRVHTIAILLDHGLGGRPLAREYRLLAEALRRRPGLRPRYRAVQRAAAAASLRLRPHPRGLQAWLASFFARGKACPVLPPAPPCLPGDVLSLLYEDAP